MTYDVCYNEAKKYEYISEFRSKSSNVYSKSCKKGYIKNFTWLKKCNSFLELFFEKNLIKNNIIYESQKTFPWLKMDRQQFLDFYLPRYNIAIECQGEQHYKPIEYFGGEKEYNLVLERDNAKKKQCEENGVKLLYFTKYKNIDGSDIYKNKNKLLKEILNYGID